MKQKIDVLIVDDEPTCRKALHTYLIADHSQLNVVGEAANGAEAYKAIKTLNPDVVFLDVNLSGENGLEVLDKCGPSSFLTVLCSADRRYASEGYKRDALYFLEKPLSVEEIDRCIEKLKQAIEDQLDRLIPEARRKVELFAGGRSHFVPVNDIVYVEAAGAYSIIYRESGKRLVVSRNLKSLMDELGGRMFCRVHNSYAVNISKIESCSFTRKHCVLSSGHEVKLAIRRSDELRKKLDYLWGSYRLAVDGNHSSQTRLLD